jgi:hypothetical protein
MKHTYNRPSRSTSMPRGLAAQPVRPLAPDDLARVQAGVFGGGTSRENFIIDGGE